MFIALFSDCYAPAINGVVTSVVQQVEILRSLGHKVDIYCPQYAAGFPDDPGTHRLWAIPFPFHQREQFAFPWPPSALRQLASTPYDVFHFQTPFAIGLLGLVAGYAKGVPRVFHHHTLWEEYVDYLPLPKRVTAAGSVALCRGLANRCQRIIAPSHQVRERFQQQGVKTPVHVIPTGIRPALFQGGQTLSDSQSESEVCLYVGRLAHEKSLTELVQVFAGVHHRRSQARLWLVGDGPARDSLEKQVQALGLDPYVRFFGFVERQVLKHYFASARVFVFTSQTETQGLVVLEAQAAGVPVVAYAGSGVNEAVEDGRTGYLVRFGEEQTMVDAVVKILEDDDHRQALSRAAQAWSLNFSVEAMGEDLEEVYRLAIRQVEKPKK